MMACSTSFTDVDLPVSVVGVGPFLRSCAGPRPFLFDQTARMEFFAAGTFLSRLGFLRKEDKHCRQLLLYLMASSALVTLRFHIALVINILHN